MLYFVEGLSVYSLCSRANPPFCSGSFPSFEECFHSHLSCHKRPQWGPIAASFRKKIVCLDVTLKAVVLKTPGQTNSGALCLLQDFLRGASLRRRGAPWWRILTKRAAIAAMRPHCAVFCHRSIAADCCPARFADEFRRRAFNASPVPQLVR